MKFPQEAYLYKEVGYKYHFCSDCIDGVAVRGKKSRVGIYQLVGQGVVTYPNDSMEPLLIRDGEKKSERVRRVR